MRHVRPGFLAAPIVVAALAVSCDTAGRSPLESITRPTSVDPHALMRVSIAGNVIFTSIGETTRFTSTATFNDGGSKDVTADGQWHSSNTGVMTVSENGEARVVGLGTCVISFDYQQQRASVNVRAGPPPISVSGRVREPGAGGLRGVVVVDTLSGRSAVTETNGSFVITELPRRQVRLRVERDGYEPREIDTSEPDVDVPIQRVVRIAAGEAVSPADLAPNDVRYTVGNTACICRLIRVVVPRAGTMGVRVQTPQTGTTLHLFAENVTAGGAGGLTADIPVNAPREVVMYVGRVVPYSLDYVPFTVETSLR
jgi:hypothetical protein